jgi:hypothetical protein
MMYKNCNIKDIESIRERADARGAALCSDKLIWANLVNIDIFLVIVFYNIQRLGKLHIMRKINKIWSLGKRCADPNTLYQRILTACRRTAGSVYEVERNVMLFIMSYLTISYGLLRDSLRTSVRKCTKGALV